MWKTTNARWTMPPATMSFLAMIRSPCLSSARFIRQPVAGFAQLLQALDEARGRCAVHTIVVEVDRHAHAFPDGDPPINQTRLGGEALGSAAQAIAEARRPESMPSQSCIQLGQVALDM